MHLYVDFVRYDKNAKGEYQKSRADSKVGIEGESYINLYKEGVKKYYEIDLVNNKYEFENINFSVKVIFHETGHALGLYDGYATEKYDRFVDNDETGIKVEGEQQNEKPN